MDFESSSPGSNPGSAVADFLLSPEKDLRLQNHDVIQYNPIGIFHSRFTELQSTPVQSTFAPQTAGEVEVDEKYLEGLKDLDSFNYIMLFYHFHRAQGYDLVRQQCLKMTLMVFLPCA